MISCDRTDISANDAGGPSGRAADPGMISRMTSSREITVNLTKGLHLVPCSRIVERANGFDGDVRIHFNDLNVDAKSILDLMMLAAPHGSILVVEATGEQADALLDELELLFAEDPES